MNTLVRLPEVMRRTGLLRAMVYKLIANRKSPAQVKLGIGVSAWVEEEIENWIAARIAQHRAGKEALHAARAHENARR